MPGITPAHAGTTHPPRSTGIGTQDHPRSRGDNDFKITLSSASLGSPPLTRGQHERITAGQRAYGITPAHAGTTPATIRHHRPRWDHPRSRGDNSAQSNRRACRRGSPPLTRGQRDSVLLFDAVAGITPAHAGTTKLSTIAAVSSEDHPRSRGDNLSVRKQYCNAQGSPPLTRGQRGEINGQP